MSSLKKVFLWISGISLFILGAVFLRPQGEVEKPSLPEKEKDSIMEKFSEQLSEDNLEKIKEKKENLRKEQNTASAQEGAFDVAESYDEHGENAVVRAKGILSEDIEKPDYPVNEPDYSNPVEITYHGLKKIYHYFKLKDGKFPPDIIEALNGSAVEITGTVMPAKPVPKNGKMPTFWLANPVVVMAGCVFCNPPTLADLIYVETPVTADPFVVNREKLFKDIVMIRLNGQFFFGPEIEKDKEYIYSIVYNKAEHLN